MPDRYAFITRSNQMGERHELFSFMRQVSAEMASEYKRISKRAVEDPGTAGDDGEENWAKVLRNWLPSTYHIVTKGRVLFEDDTTSPQVDILVLSPDYPLHLLNKKKYFAGGVIAVFECKLSLKKKHISDFFKVSELIKSRSELGDANLFEEFNSRIIVGLLAHTHSWTKKQSISDQVYDIFDRMVDIKEGLKFEKAKLYPDVLCISDTVTYYYSKTLLFKESADKEELKLLHDLESETVIGLSYDAFWSDEDNTWFEGTVLGSLVSFVIHRMAFRNPSLRDWAKYLMGTDISAVCVGHIFFHPYELDSTSVDNYFKYGGASNSWNPWGKNL